MTTFQILSILAAGGGGGSGLIGKASTYGGVIYLTMFILHLGHIVGAWIRKDRAAARDLARAKLDEEYKL